MKITAKVNLARLRVKIRRWRHTVTREQQEAVRAYGAEACGRLLRHTAPADGSTAPATAITKLRRRISEDWEGQGASVPFQEDDISWFRDSSGRPRAYFKAANSSATGRGGRSVTGRVSPFRPVFGRPSRKVLAALNVGRYGVRFVEDIDAHIRAAAGNYRVVSTSRGKKARLSWYGPRHLVQVARLRKQVRSRKNRAGTLMAGWKPLAAATGAKLPAAVRKHTASGSCRIRKNSRHGALLTATNSTGYTALQHHVDKTIPALRRRLRTLARKRVSQTLAPKLRKI